MRYRTLGRTDLEVSEVGFEGIPIQKIGMDEAVQAVEKALNLGVNYIDTARSYTDSEEKIARTIQGRRDECRLATKTNKRVREEVEKELATSSRVLGTSRLDVYHLHSVGDGETLGRILAPGDPSARKIDLKASGLVIPCAHAPECSVLNWKSDGSVVLSRFFVDD